MRFFPVAAFAAGISAAVAGALYVQGQTPADKIEIQIDGKPFATFNYGTAANKPFLAPIRAASGTIITRGFPMENIEGESRDHLHHRGLWFSYDDVNGVKFWENDPSYTKPNIGKIVVRNASYTDGGTSGTLKAQMEWRAPKGEVLLMEDRDMVVQKDPKLRIMDFHITLAAAKNVVIGDTKEGAFAIRLIEPFTERKGMKMVDADGRTRMGSIWGKRSNWVDYSTDVSGEKLGVAIFDSPKNPNHPTYWHARDYGLFALNPFGQNAFDPNAPERTTKLSSGEKISFVWRVVIHPGDAESAHVASLYQDFAAKQ